MRQIWFLKEYKPQTARSWRLMIGVQKPMNGEGNLYAILHRKNMMMDKLIVCPGGVIKSTSRLCQQSFSGAMVDTEITR
jgi:hypothetical protein